MSKYLISDAAICEAYVWALHLHRNKYDTRPLRWLHDRDFSTLHDVRAELARSWKAEMLRSPQARKGFQKWRTEQLDTIAKRDSWSPATRNLYSSMLAILQTWSLYGQNQETKATLQELMKGASLLLQFLNRYQPSMFDSTKRKK